MVCNLKNPVFANELRYSVDLITEGGEAKCRGSDIAILFSCFTHHAAGRKTNQPKIQKASNIPRNLTKLSLLISYILTLFK